MERGFSLAELMTVVAIIAVAAGLALPSLVNAWDALAAERAAVQVTTAFSVTRNAAVMWGARARVRFAPDTLRIDRFEDTGWVAYARWPGPAAAGVALEVSNPEVIFGPTGMGWGAANTKVILRRGSHSETITMSRVGRVKRW